MTTDNNKPRFFLGGKVRKNYDGDPDWDTIGRAGLKTLKAMRALGTYERHGEPAYDEMGGYKPGQDKVDLKHHEELKKNLKANERNETIMRSKKMKEYLKTHHEGRVYAQNQMNGARDYATKWDNKARARAYVGGYQGFSASKIRERKGREKKGK